MNFTTTICSVSGPPRSRQLKRQQMAQSSKPNNDTYARFTALAMERKVGARFQRQATHSPHHRRPESQRSHCPLVHYASTFNTSIETSVSIARGLKELHNALRPLHFLTRVCLRTSCCERALDSIILCRPSLVFYLKRNIDAP